MSIMEHTFADLTIRIDREQCIGTGNCVKVAPTVFEIDEDNIVRFRASPGPATPDQLTEACRVCPVDALTAIDASGNIIVP